LASNISGDKGALATIERRRRINQNCKGCQTIALGSLESGADEGVTDQG
jgi:hypothetical protein